MLSASATRSALNAASDPLTPPKDYAAAVKVLIQDLVDQAIRRDAFRLEGIHVVAAAADYELVVEPSLKALSKDNEVAVSCLWPISNIIVEGAVDSTTISMGLSEKSATEMPQLLVLAQSIGTITELEAILAHVLFDMGPNDYRQIVVLSLVSHVDIEQLLDGILPEKYKGKLLLLDHRKDYELSVDGVLTPGVGYHPVLRGGFLSPSATRTFIPDRFRKKYDFTKKPKLERNPAGKSPNPFG